MQKPDKTLRVLVFNWCEVRLRHMARTGHSFHLVPPYRNSHKNWHRNFWPLPENVVEVDWSSAECGVRTGDYDLLLCQTLDDLTSTRAWGIPRLFAPLAMDDSASAGQSALRAELHSSLEDISLVFDSEQKKRSWGLEGQLLRPGIDPDEFASPTGETPAVLHFRTEMSDSLGCGQIEEAVLDSGLSAVLVDLGSERLDWESVKESLRCHRVLFSPLPEVHSDGYQPFVLAAMAAGMPVVTTANICSPITDGLNGFAASDYQYLREKLQLLLSDRELAAALGRNARQTVEERFHIRDHIADWNAVFAECMSGKGVAQASLGASPPRVSIAISVCNEAESTEACLLALVQNSGADIDYEAIVVNNGSSDWTHYLLHAFEGDLRVIHNEENLGFARANNQAADIALGEYLLFLDNDVIPQPGWLGAMVRLADSDSSIGIVGAEVICAEMDIVRNAGFEFVNGSFEPVSPGVVADDPHANTARDCDMVTGSCMLVRRDFFAEIGGFAVREQDGVEGVDLCLRARAHGWRVAYCPDSVVEYHKESSRGRYELVKDNLQRLADRWQGSLDARGRLPGEVGVEPFAESVSVDSFQSLDISSPSRSTDAGSADGTIVVLGSVADEVVKAAVEGSGIDGPRYDVQLRADLALGEQLEAVRQDARGEFLVIIGQGVGFSAEVVHQLIDCLRREPQIALAAPSVSGVVRGSGIEELEIPDGGLLVFRQQALQAVGGFDPRFRSEAVLSEAGRKIGRQGGRIVRVLECVVEGEFCPGSEIYEDEFESIRSLAEGDRMRAMGDDEAALDAYRSSVAAKGDFVESIVVLAAMLMEVGKPLEAAKQLEQLVKLDEASFQAHKYLGLARYQAGQVEAGRASLQRAHMLNPSYVEILVNLAVLEWEQGRQQDAIDYMERAVALEPDNRDVIVNTGIMQAQAGNEAAGIALLQDYLDHNPYDLEVTSALADLLIAKDDLAAAGELAARLLAFDPQCRVARTILEKIGE